MDPARTKRPYEALEQDHKRPRVDAGGATAPTDAHDDLEYLKTLIKQELMAVYDGQLVQLQQQVAELQEKYTDLAEKVDGTRAAAVPPPLPPRTLSSSLSLGSKPVLTRKPSNEPKPKHTFGGTLFNIKPMVATPTNSVSAPSLEKTPKDPAPPKDPAQTPAKPVFGSSTSFGNTSFSESLKERKNVFAGLSSASAGGAGGDGAGAGASSSASPAGAGASFGSNTRFSNAFQNSLNKKSFLDDSKPPESPANENASSDKDSEQYKQVKLNPIKNTTGEEDEKSHFNATCKLFELNLGNISEGWKERGLGQIHLNQSYHDPNQVRLVMRSNGLLRVILNSKITSTTEFFKGSEATLNPGKYLRFNVMNSVPVQYLLKFSNQGLRDELVEKIDELKQSIAEKQPEAGSRPETSEPQAPETSKPQAPETTEKGVQWT